MAVRDPETEWLRVQIYRKMTPQQRIMIAANIYEDGVDMVRSSIVDHRPNISQEELERQVRRRLLSRHLFEKVEAALAQRDSVGIE